MQMIMQMMTMFKDDVQFQSFRKVLDSSMKAGIGTNKNFSGSSNRMKNIVYRNHWLSFIESIKLFGVFLQL